MPPFLIESLQRLGRALMLPIAILPIAGLLLRLGDVDLLDIPLVHDAGKAIFANLALIFAIGIAVGFARDNNGTAGLAGAIGYLGDDLGAQGDRSGHRHGRALRHHQRPGGWRPV